MLRTAFAHALRWHFLLFIAFTGLAISGCHGSSDDDDSSRTPSSLEVAPSEASIAKGTHQQFAATAIFDDGTSEDVTESVDWSSSDTSVASVSGSGRAQGLNEGVTTITASLDDLSGEATLTVTPAVIVEMQVQPSSAGIVEGTNQQFTATGIFSDGTNQDLSDSAAWSSSNTAVAGVDATGLATGLSAGQTQISASFGGQSDSSALTVIEAVLDSLQVEPGTASIAGGTTQQFTATGSFNNGALVRDVTTDVQWSSSDEAVATIDAGGLATGVDPGMATITAMLDGESDSAELTVTEAVLDRVEVTPVNAELPVGLSQQYEAIAVFTDDSTQDVTNSVLWASTDRDIADISNADGSRGLAVGKSPGMVTISATFEGETGSTGLTVTEAVITGIDVEPANSQLPNGFQRQFTATGLFSDGSNRDITQEATWTSSNNDLAQVSNADGSRGLVTADDVNTGSLAIRAALDGEEDATSLEVTDANLDSIQLSPNNDSTPLGVDVQYMAVGIFDDGSSLPLTQQVTWASSDTAVATISNADGSQGLATPVAPGTTMISATRDAVTGQTELTVTEAALESITIEPVDESTPLGIDVQYTATGTFSDGSTEDITTSVTWASSDTDVATIDGNGLATPAGEGMTEITASSGGITSNTANLTVTAAVLDSLEVTPADTSVAAGVEVQYTATGTFSDGSMMDLTAEVTWTSSDTDVATISNADGSEGLADTFVPGMVTITATLEGVTDETTLTVTDAVVESIEVTPENPSVPKGRTQQFTATATFTDGSTRDITGDGDTTWTSDNESVATMDAAQKGLATAVAEGEAVITAQFGGVEGSTTMTVTGAEITSIAVSPANPALPVGFERQFTAEASFSDGSTMDVTGQVSWASFDNGIATISGTGLATGVAAGVVTITATADGISGSTDLTVEDAVLQTIDVNPKDEQRTVADDAGTTIQYTATGSFDTGTVLDITTQVFWESSEENVATISNAEGSEGEATVGSVPGETTISAGRDGVTGITTLTVDLL